MTIEHARHPDDTRTNVESDERRGNCFCGWRGTWCEIPVPKWDSPTPTSQWQAHMTQIRDSHRVGSRESCDAQDVLDNDPGGQTMGEFCESFTFGRS